MDKILKTVDFEVRAVDKEKRTLTAIASTETKDRLGDIIRAKGWQLKNFKKNPVLLWAHSYGYPPIGKVSQIKVEDEKLKFEAQFANKETFPFADTVFNLYAEGFMNAFSVGFIALKAKPIEKDEDEDDDDSGVWKRPGREFLKQELLEISAVPVPANFEALKEKGMQDLMTRSFEDMLKRASKQEGYTVIPFKKYPLVDEGVAWSAPKEIAAAEVSDLKMMGTLYLGDGESKGDYKLPHHRAADKHTVWKGVAAAMAALLGARGGIKPAPSDAEKKGAYSHLSKHYVEFDKEAPELRDYSEAELKEMFSDKEENKDTDDIIFPFDVKDANELYEIMSVYKSGRVISEKNRKVIQAAIESMNKAVVAMKNLLTLSEPKPKDDDKDKNKDKEVVSEEQKAVDDLIADINMTLSKARK